MNKTRYNIKCPVCGKYFANYHDKKYCTYDCYRKVPFPRLGITIDDIESCYGMTIKDAAAELGISYVQLRRFLKKNDKIRSNFPNSAEGRWLSVRGYCD